MYTLLGQKGLIEGGSWRYFYPLLLNSCPGGDRQQRETGCPDHWLLEQHFPASRRVKGSSSMVPDALNIRFGSIFHLLHIPDRAAHISKCNGEPGMHGARMDRVVRVCWPCRQTTTMHVRGYGKLAEGNMWEQESRQGNMEADGESSNPWANS